MQFALSSAARLLGITPRTLKKWLRLADIEPVGDGVDRRERMITLEELRLVAAERRRPLIIPRDPREELTLESLAVRLEVLEQSFHLLQRKMEQTGGGLAERVLRNVRTNPTAQASATAVYPSMRDVEDIVQAAIDLVNKAPQVPPSQIKEIIVTFQGETDIFDLVPLLRREWRRALEGAMRRGWRVVHLIRQSEDLPRAMTVAEDLMQLLTGPRGAYLPLFMPLPAETSTPLREYVAVPEVGILELECSDGQHIDVAFSHQPGRQRELLHANLRRIREASIPIVSVFPSLSVEFSRAIADSESAEGHRCLVMNGLSELTIPLSIHQERAESILVKTSDPLTRQKVKDLLATRAQREAAFERQVHRWQHRDVCPMGAIQDYVKTGVYSPDDIFGALGCPPLTSAQRATHLKHLIHRLETCPNYELGLVDESVHDVSVYQTFWLVKAGHVVLLECQSLTAEGREEETDLAISEPRVVDAFYEHFFRLWAHLGPVNQDKQHVVAWLKAQLAEIPQHG